MPQPKGGARPGAGRPCKLDKYGGHVAAAEDRIADRLPELIDKAFELANGVEVQKLVRGNAVVYSQPPSIGAIMFLFERIAGKVPQALEHSGPDGSGIPFDLKVLPGGELDDLKRIVARLAGREPQGSIEGDRG